MKITLKAARINKGMTQIEAAELLGISCATLRSWEKGTTTPSLPLLDALIHLYEIRYDDINFMQKKTNE